MKLPSDKDLEWYRKHGVTPPSHEEHGEFDMSKLEKIKATKWWTVGNELHAETQFGELVQRIPTGYICLGTDKRGLPILAKPDIK